MIDTTLSAIEPLTLAELVERFGPMPAHRIRTTPAPGTATEEDLLAAESDRLCELVDGVLVEKAMGYYESQLAIILGHLLHAYLTEWFARADRQSPPTR